MNIETTSKLEQILETYVNRNVMFGFRENLEISDDSIKISGYTYFAYDIAFQMYVPDFKEAIEYLKKNNLLESRIKKAKELFGDATEESILSADGWFDYMQRAKAIKKTLSNLRYVSVTITDEDYNIFVDVSIDIPNSKDSDTLLSKIMQTVSNVIIEEKTL